MGYSRDAVRNFSLRNLTVDANYLRSEAAINAIQVANSKRFVVSNVKVENAGRNGILFLAAPPGVSESPVVQNSLIENSGLASTDGNDGFGVRAIDTARVTVRNNVLRHNTGMGIGLSLSPTYGIGSPDSQIRGNLIYEAPSKIGYEAIGVTVKCDRSTIADNTILDSHDNGISASSDHSTVTRNRINGSMNHGIAVGGSHNIVSYNSINHPGFHSARGGPLTYAGIALDGSYNKLIENRISDTRSPRTLAYGIKQNATIGGNTLERNIISGWLLSKYYWTPRGDDELSDDNTIVEP